MKKLPWIILALGLSGFALWVVTGPWYPKNSFAIFLLALFFGLSALGGWWMLYVAVKHEKHPLRFVLLALIPYAFIWYYFERFQPGNHRTRVPPTA